MKNATNLMAALLVSTLLTGSALAENETDLTEDRSANPASAADKELADDKADLSPADRSDSRAALGNTGALASDTWLKAKLMTTYALNRHLSVFDIDADVKNRVVTLTGTVETGVEKELAAEVAKSIEGIQRVDNKLVVDETKARADKDKRGKEDRSFGRRIDDLTTTASIKSKFLANSSVEGLDINVDTVNGRVSLRGEVETDAQRALAEQIAKNTEGVAGVDNELTVAGEGR